MGHLHGLEEILFSFLIVFLISIPVGFLANRLKVPSVVSFLITGVLIGPSGLGLLKDPRVIEIFAELGVIFLMFTIGIEFSIKKFIAYRREVLFSGFFQVLITTLIVLVLTKVFLGETISKGLFYGTLIAMSSTALVLKMLMDRGELNTPYGRTSFGILIFQDLIVVVIMLLLPILAENKGSVFDLVVFITKSFALLTAIFLIAMYFVPYIFHQIVKTKSRELFLMTVLSLALGTAFISYKLGLSLALGAFLAGMIISESEYAYQSIAEIKPLKDLLITIFFISVGLILKPQFLLDQFTLSFVILLVLFFVKFVGILLSAIIVSKNLRNSLLTTFYLLQVGEFSFILALEAKRYALIDETFYQVFIGISTVSLFVTPFWIQFSHNITEFIISKLRPGLYKRYRKYQEVSKEPFLKDHTIVVGYGIAGKNVVYGLKSLKIPYIILELNPFTVKKYKSKGEPIYFGDATNREILIKFGIKTAKVLVISMGDVISARKIVTIAREENPNLYIIVRSKFVAEIEELLRLGANEVIPEEFEVSIEIFAKVLEVYKVPKNIIYELLENIRSKHYKAFRTIQDIKFLSEINEWEFLKELTTQNFLIRKASGLIGKTIKDTELRKKTGATIIAINRKGRFIVNPQPEEVLKEGDILILIGKEEEVNKAISYLSSF